MSNSTSTQSAFTSLIDLLNRGPCCISRHHRHSPMRTKFTAKRCICYTSTIYKGTKTRKTQSTNHALRNPKRANEAHLLTYSLTHPPPPHPLTLSSYNLLNSLFFSATSRYRLPLLSFSNLTFFSYAPRSSFRHFSRCAPWNRCGM